MASASQEQRPKSTASFRESAADDLRNVHLGISGDCDAYEVAEEEQDYLPPIPPVATKPAAVCPRLPTTKAELLDLAGRAQQGDHEAAQLLGQTLDENPAIWRSLGDLARNAEEALIVAASAGNMLVAESLRREIVAIKEGLLGENPTRLERMVVQRVAATWLFVQYADLRYAASSTNGVHCGAWARSQELAEKRYHKSLKSFELVRRICADAGRRSQSVANASNGSTDNREIVREAPKAKKRATSRKASAGKSKKRFAECAEKNGCHTATRPTDPKKRPTRKAANRVSTHFEQATTTTRNGSSKRKGGGSGVVAAASG